MSDPRPLTSGRPRRRDRRGRGLRGPLFASSLPAHRTRAERFDDVLLDVVAELEARLPGRLQDVEFGVEDAPVDPAAAPLLAGDRRIAFGRHVPAGQDGPARVVLYRRPIQVRASDDGELAFMIRTVAIDCVADLLGMDPEDIDPDLGR